MKTINNDIQESYCSFEVSKLLKEKGFKCICFFHCYSDHTLNKPHLSASPRDSVYNHLMPCPTHALAIEWIRVNFGIHVESQMNIPQEGEQDGCFVWNGIVKTDSEYKVVINHITDNKSSSQKATEAALLYVLKELI